MKKFRNISLKNKIFFSTLTVILLLSGLSAVDTRLVLIQNMIDELKLRGIGIAQSIAERGRGFVLTEEAPGLVSLIFDVAKLEEHRQFVLYIFILDPENNVLAHTFVDVFPDFLRLANPIPPKQPRSIRLLKIKYDSAYDIAVPIMEGIYRIGSVHIGLNKKHMDHLIGTWRITYLGIIFAIIGIFFLVSHWLSNYITRPISELTKVADEISRGNLDIKPTLGSETKCWEIQNCRRDGCPAHENTEFPCWYVDETQCPDNPQDKFPEKLNYCYECPVYARRSKDEVGQLADSFIHMTNRLKFSQIQLKESEEKYRSLFDSGPNPIFVLDHNALTILDANPRAEETYGYTKEELLGRPYADLAPFEYEILSGVNFENNTRKNSYKTILKVRQFKKDNTPFFVNVHACPTRYKHKNALIVAATDITEMMEKDTQLIQAGKMTALGEMSAGIAHELNQPLNAIKMGSEFLKMMIEEGRTIPEQSLLEVVTEVNNQVNRAAETINRLREFGRKADFTKENIDINRPIRGVLGIIGQQLRLQNIEVVVDLDETLPSIWAHNNRLEQVVFNMVINARDAINQKQKAGNEKNNRIITLRTFEENNRVAVTVSDTGIGIPEPAKDKIFEPFFTTKEIGKGMGLGLSIIYGIVRDYNGEIDVDSQEGTGTTFKITFPAAASLNSEK